MYTKIIELQTGMGFSYTYRITTHILSLEYSNGKVFFLNNPINKKIQNEKQFSFYGKL